MKTRHWLIIAAILSLGLVIALVPAVFAQGPLNNDGAGFGSGPVVDAPGFGRGWMTNGAGVAGMGRGQGVMPGQGRMMNGAAGMMNGRGNADAPRLAQAIMPGVMFGRSDGWGGPDNSLVAVTASVLEMDRQALIAQLQTGQTLADVISDHGVALETVVEEFVSPRAAVLAEKVAAGEVTQEQADALLTSMRANATQQLQQEWSARGPGGGNGFVDEDGDGVCDNCGAGRGRGFVDEDGDGVCDNCGAGAGQVGGRGQGRMMGRWSQ